ncbi:MAG TPA: phosphatidylserine/phosphatidylglycerophosphate/cardiolipin synthase family protein [Stenomitos sp.]
MAIRGLDTRLPALQQPTVRAGGPTPAATAPAVAPVARDTFVRTQPTSFAQAISPFVATPFRPGNQVDLFINGDEVFPQIHKLLDSAKERIDMEFFAFTDDPTGREIGEKLIGKAKEGVQVNVLVDKVSQLNSNLMKHLEDNGVRVQRFTNGYQTPLLHANNITDHRKIILVDGKAGMTGGMNLAERYEKYWHDVMVKFQGPSLQDVYSKFEANWKLSGGDAVRPIKLDLAPKGSHSVQVAVTSKNEREIRDSFLAAFKTAKENINVQSPYFIDEDMVKGLTEAAKRGVKVHVQVPSVGDNSAVDLMNRSVINQLRDANVDVYQYDTMNYQVGKHDHVTDHFNHAKIATFDGKLSIIGTANMDHRSMAMSQEINLHVESEQFAKEIEERFFKKDVLLKKATPAMKQVMSGKEKIAEKVLNSMRHLF